MSSLANKQNATAVSNTPASAVKAAAGASLLTMLGFASLQFALAYVEALSANAVPVFASSFTESKTLIFLIVSLNPFFNIFVQPYVGWKGDRIWTPLGRRKPFILAGAPFLILFLILTPYASPTMRFGLTIAFLLILFFQFFQDVVFGAYMPLFGDIFTDRQRGMASGLQQITAGLGHFVCLTLGVGILAGTASSIPAWLAKILPEKALHLGSTLPPYMSGWKGSFLLGAIFMFVCSLTVLSVRERPPLEPPKKESFRPGAYYRELFANPQWIMLYLSMLFLTIIPVFILSGYMLYATKCLNLERGQAAVIWSLWPLIQLLLASPVGYIADRVRRRSLIYVSLGLAILASLCGLFANSVQGVYIFTALFGIAIAVQRVGFLPIVADYVPPDKVGTVMGGVTQLRGISNFLALPAMGMLMDLLTKPLGVQVYRVPFVLSALAAVITWFCLKRLGNSAYTDRA